MLRAWAWLAGGAAFFAPWLVFAGSPRPAVAAGSADAKRAEGRKVIVIRKITRRVVVTDQPSSQPVQYVYVGGSSSGSSGGSAPPAPTTSGGS
jgi:hypothetical protein